MPVNDSLVVCVLVERTSTKWSVCHSHSALPFGHEWDACVLDEFVGGRSLPGVGVTVTQSRNSKNTKSKPRFKLQLLLFSYHTAEFGPNVDESCAHLPITKGVLFSLINHESHSFPHSCRPREFTADNEVKSAT